MRNGALVSLVCILVACGLFNGPGNEGEHVIVPSPANGLSVRRVTNGGLVARVGPALLNAFIRARSLDSTQLFYVAGSHQSAHQLLSLNAQSLQIEWGERVVDLKGKSKVDSLEFPRFVDAIAPSPNAAELWIAPAFVKGASGIAVLSTTTREAVDFLGPLDVAFDGMALIATAPTDSGLIAVAATRVPAHVGPVDGWLFLFNATSRAISDSIQLTKGVARSWGGLGQVAASPDGKAVYVRGPGVLFRYDLGTRQLSQGSPGPVGRLSVAPDGRVYLGDTGEWESHPSTGFLYRYGPDLSAVDTIDLTSASVGGVGPTVQGAAASHDGHTLYVLIGNRKLVVGQFANQELRILVVDAATKEIKRSLPLNEWGDGPIFVR